AYAADDTAGLEVINYLAYDAKGVPPTIALAPSSLTNGVAEGTLLYVTANAGDDVQVRNVEFYLDGQKVFSDGNFPFEYRFVAPPLTAAKTNLTLRARALDTGGNATATPDMIIPLLSVGPLQVTGSTPLVTAKILH